ncbi:MAG TPA: hypothetical protein VLW55_14225 [Burkholderiaceae bacterium]|nr:hypothetical protein [Burkholderiaceae bacterium]
MSVTFTGFGSDAQPLSIPQVTHAAKISLRRVLSPSDNACTFIGTVGRCRVKVRHFFLYAASHDALLLQGDQPGAADDESGAAPRARHSAK